ncbi:Monothiol glutaredoxin-S8 [Hibiscus syriacus]|uniref:Monothiol glutaredoxin-S8 n=1 Tax=Hibiscus syriacus TaxID=106335 RepID=A0A6A2XNI8_HIBSY|nr:monothiol glutaredoxin-S4-like [Hibiscus syriacus]KAE8677991.1 Monothiol glutaredoxin-S8 [Hibiscus syriacus]
MERATKLASEKPEVIFNNSLCCMSHTIKTLFYNFGFDPAIHPSVLTVFTGGELVGGTNQIMSLHLNRSLIPMLKQVGALWV